jgi:copper chaperone
MEQVIDAENIKCGGCASTIRSKLGALEGVSNVRVEIENGRVTVEAHADGRAGLAETLLAKRLPGTRFC